MSSGGKKDIISLSSFKYLEGRYFLTAVLKVFNENKRNFKAKTCPIPADADEWIHVEHLRQYIHAMTRFYWCELTGRRDTWFPYSVDGVCRIYLRIRKRSSKAITQFGIDLGPLKQIPEKKPSKRKGQEEEEPEDAS